MNNSQGNCTNESNTYFGSIKYTKTVPSKDSVEIHANWIIPHFMELYEKNKDIIAAPSSLHGCEWQTQLKIVYKNKNQIDIGLKFTSPTQDPTVFLRSMKLKMFTFDKYHFNYDKELTVISQARNHITKAGVWIKNKTLSVEDSHIMDPLKDDKICLLRNGSLHINYELVIIEREKEDQFQVLTTPPCITMENFFLNNKFTDVVLKSTDDKEFRAHKVVLASKCAVLNAHFEHNTTESITNIVETPLEAAVLHEVLSFIYTDKAPKADEIPEKLLAGADFYQLSHLKSLCEKALYEKLTIDNAIEIFQLADIYSASTLKRLTLEFIRIDGHLKLITNTASWAKLQSFDLLKMIFKDIINL